MTAEEPAERSEGTSESRAGIAALCAVDRTPLRVAVDDLDTSYVIVRSKRISNHWVTQLCETPTDWPPILVTSDLKVLDGHHRVEAARRLRYDHIEAVITRAVRPAEALEAAIAANSSHGLSLSRAERTQLVDRLLNAAPLWSDRRIAAAVGVSPTTVGKRRKHLSDTQQPNAGVHGGHPPRRIGRDGKTYPVGGVQMDTSDGAPGRWKKLVRRIRSLVARVRAAVTG